MRRIEAIVRPEKVEECLTALEDLGVHGITVYEATGHGAQGGIDSQLGGKTHRIRLLPKSVLVVAVHDHESESTVQALMTAAGTGHCGDGKIFVSTINEAIRVRTGETGTEAL
ncbi:MAG: transcriptional regulator [Actinobacteria bacterium HGW-Actinobacteria-7]|nr:MAG: transcriptional regulator [Actinobacteria bacterium HGW-Actinobacteria-7]